MYTVYGDVGEEVTSVDRLVAVRTRGQNRFGGDVESMGVKGGSGDGLGDNGIWRSTGLAWAECPSIGARAVLAVWVSDTQGGTCGRGDIRGGRYEGVSAGCGVMGERDA